MPIEEIDLGLQPKVTELDDGTMDAQMVPSKEWRATGKEVHDPEFGKLLDQATEFSEGDSARKESIFGMERMSLPGGGETLVRGDKVEQAKRQGYGHECRNPRMTVPALPWQADRRFGERYDDYMKRKAEGRTLIQYQDGRRLVYINGELQMNKGEL